MNPREGDPTGVTISSLLGPDVPRDVRLRRFVTRLTTERGISPEFNGAIYSYAERHLRISEIFEAGPNNTTTHAHHNANGEFVKNTRTEPEMASEKIQFYIEDAERILETDLSRPAEVAEAAQEAREYLVVFFG